METIIALFGHLDPRDLNSRHDFCEILFIAIAASLCGAKHCSDMWRFGQEKEEMLRQVLKLPYGVPSHDTFSSVFRNLNPQAFAEAFARFVRGFAGAISRNRQIAIDGKAMRGAFETGRQFAPRMMVSAWCREVRMTLAAQPAAGGNEAKAALELLRLLDLEGAIVTGDALHCTSQMAGEIKQRGGDYVLALKGNQAGLCAAAEKLAAATKTPKKDIAVTEEEAHGRIERRSARVIAAPRLGKLHAFPGLVAIAEVERVRILNGKREQKRWLYVLSRCMGASDLLDVVRGHWDIENGLHWGLDVIFREDDCRTRKDHGPENLALIRRMCGNTLRLDRKKDTIRGKMMRAAWNDSYLFKLMTQMR